MLRTTVPILIVLAVACAAHGEPATRPATGPASPRVTSVPIPHFQGQHAIWGSSGVDSRGHVWFGVSAKYVQFPSAHLFEYIPQTGETVDRGHVVGELKRLGLLRPGEGQMKIHTRIIQAADGHLYFASFDEEGEKADGSRTPKWGGHLWRLRLPENRWEHLLTAPEALIAVAGNGRWIYALGYFGHVIHQYDTQTGQTRLVKVGSVDGHIPRNILADDRGHVYVPRLFRGGSPETVQVELVEFSAELKELGKTALLNYLSGKPTGCHGIVALDRLPDGSLCFITAKGWLYRIVPRADGPAQVNEVGCVHPRGESYSASLFAPDAKGPLRVLSRAKGFKGYEWLMYDLDSLRCEVRPFTVDQTDFPPTDQVLLYGSTVRDPQGRFYVVGTYQRQKRPLLLQIQE